MNIAEFVDRLLESRGLSEAQLAELLGYRSKTSIARIRRLESGEQSLNAFAHRLRRSLKLSSEEDRTLSDAIDCMHWQEDLPAVQRIAGFLSGDVEDPPEPVLQELLPCRTEAAVTLSERYADAAQLDIALVNCHHVPIYRSLLQLLRCGHAQVRHYLLPRHDTSDTIEMFRRVADMALEPGYQPCSISIDPAVGHHGLLASDIMIVTLRDAAGSHREEMIIFDRPGHGTILAGARPGDFRRLLSLSELDCTPLKRSFEGAASPQDYARFILEFADLEQNRTIYRLRPDVCIDWIAPDILRAALEPVLCDDPELRQAMPELQCIHARRYRNNFKKHQPSYSVLRQSALWRFAETGCSADHFWAMRPFTPRERVRILSELHRQLRTNPYFHLHLLRDNHLLRDREFILYEGVGLLITDMHAHYDLAHGHSEIMISHPEFLRLFQEYCARVLLRSCVLEDGETDALFQQMIRHCAALPQ